MGSIVTSPTSSNINKPDSWEKGHAFEDYIITLFKSKRFRLIHWRSDKKASNGVTPLSNSYPDLEFAYSGPRKNRFAVECKWREKFYKEGIKWASTNQIKGYLDFQKEYGLPVFIAIGIGGIPQNPLQLFVTPLMNISGQEIVNESNLILYKRNTKNNFYYDAEQLRLF